jgi:hypothetical protein
MARIRERLESVRKLHRIEVLPLNVLDDRKLEPVGRCHVQDDGRKRFPSGELAGSEPTLSHHEFKAAPRLTHDHGLQHTMLTNRTREVCKARRAELSPRLIRIRID